MWTALGIAFTVSFFIWLALRKVEKLGKVKAMKDNAEKVIDNVQKAKDARDKLNDPIERQRLRDKFKRK